MKLVYGSFLRRTKQSQVIHKHSPTSYGHMDSYWEDQYKQLLGNKNIAQEFQIYAFKWSH